MQTPHHRWSFINKEQRRQAHAHGEAEAQRCCRKQAAEIDARTHLKHQGRKGYLGFVTDLQVRWRHAGNLLYARWVRAKHPPYVTSQN